MAEKEDYEEVDYEGAYGEAWFRAHPDAPKSYAEAWAKVERIPFVNKVDVEMIEV